MPKTSATLHSEPWMLHPGHFEELTQLAKSRHAELAELPERASKTDRIPGMRIENGYAFAWVNGVMGKHLDIWDVWFLGMYDVALLEHQLLEAGNREDIHTIVISFNSPGGAAACMAELAALIREVAANGKRMIAWTDSLAGSAAYYLASACDEIYASPTAIVGSIGCFWPLVDDSTAWANAGLKLEAFTSAPGKLYGHPGKEMTDEARAFFQSRVDELGGQFRSFVKKSRPAATKEALDSGLYGSAGTWGRTNGLVDGTFLTFDHMLAALLASATID